MDNIFEILIPLIIAAVYFFGNMFSGKSEEDGGAPPLRPRERTVADEEEADALERQRRIQEEIRRKIMERRRASSSEPPQLAPAGEQPQQGRREVHATRETRDAQKETREFVHQTRDERPAAREASPQPFSWDESDNAYDSEMQAQLERIEATKRQAEILQNQAAKRRHITKDHEKPKRRTGGYFAGTVRDSLRDPQAARVAFIYGEVLGQPISLKKGASSVPGLNGP